MRELDKKISEEVNKGRRRIFLVQLLNFLLIGASFGITVSIFVVVLSRIIPIYGVYTKSLWITLIFMLAGLVYAIIKYPQNIYTALKVDALGLKERLVTAVELKNNDSPLAIMQKKIL
ncbi:hypothetical protein ACFIJ5_17200 [Haloimpatiens sp. FM7330]|uniref:hypothetical protein n=1 Tax=Haloimpatiens sp. FM7330 TaxID=3298610 RepID=UPI0036337ADE